MSTSRVFYYHNPKFGTCPDCKKRGTLQRSRPRTMTEQIIRRMTFYKIYRCKECGWRGYRSTIIMTKKSLKAIAFYLLLIGATAIVARYIITRFVSI